jgi:GH25 family lysozyme M1 (1,4-beta-N-acetylmuramidase)
MHTSSTRNTFFLPFVFTLLFLIFYRSSGTSFGIDIYSDALTPSDWECLKTKGGLKWAVFRAYHSFGAFDNSSLVNIKYATDANVDNVDVYMFPCRGKDASAQAKDLLTNLKNAPFQTVWLDIEENPSKGCSWTMETKENNCQFVQTLINALTQGGVSVGVYSSHYEWNLTLGENCEVANSLPIWYAHYDGESNCKDFLKTTFGGWKKPFAKQFNDNVKKEKTIDSCIENKIPADIDVLCDA